MYIKDDVKKTTSKVSDYPKVYGSVTAIERSDKNRPIKTRKFIIEQGNDSYCRNIMYNKISSIHIHFRQKRFLTRVRPIHGARQKVFPGSVRAQMLYQSHCAALAGQSCERRTYDTMRM